MPELLILIGLPASGKTTFATELLASPEERLARVKARLSAGAPLGTTYAFEGVPSCWERVNWDDLRAAEPNWRFTREREMP